MNASEAGRALRAIPSERRAAASRRNGQWIGPRMGGRPMNQPDRFTVVYFAPGSDVGVPGGSVSTLAMADRIARQTLAPGHEMSLYLGGSDQSVAGWRANERGRIVRVRD